MRVLIVAAQPYRPSGNSRALFGYLSEFSSNELAQVFSDRRTPIQGLCDSLFQITDWRLAKRRFQKIPDILFHKENLSAEDEKGQISVRSPVKNKTPLYRLLRKAVWKKKFWDTPELEKFVDDFSPDAIFVIWGPDFWQMDVAIHFSKTRNIPVVIWFFDDCIFNLPKKGAFARTYSKKFAETFDDLLGQTIAGIYVSDKLRNAYFEKFGLAGVTIPVSSSRPLKTASTPNLLAGDFLYCGTLEEGRKDTLMAFAKALERAKKDQKVIVYSADSPKGGLVLPNIEFRPPVLYERLRDLEAQASAVISCEGFSKENLDIVRYSLSTKVGDCLRSGKVLLSLGPIGAGSVDFLREKEAALCCTSLNEMDQFVEEIYSKTGEELLGLVEKELAVGKEFDLETNAKKCKEYLVNLIKRH